MAGRTPHSDEQITAALTYLKTHTTAETCEEFGIHRNTLKRWTRQSTPAIIDQVERNTTELVGLPWRRQLIAALEHHVSWLRGANPVDRDEAATVSAMAGSLKVLYELKITEDLLHARNAGETGEHRETAGRPAPGEPGHISAAMAAHPLGQRLHS